jgi:hypothetical protein
MTNHFVLVRVIAMLLACSAVTWAQWNKKPYTEWSEKESLKLLNDSPWGQTQTFTDTSRSASTTRSGTGQTTAIAETINVRFRIRFMSAKPVRQAIGRVMELQRQGELPASVAKQLKAFAAAEFPDYIIITVTCDADSASNMLQQANSLLSKLTTVDLKNNTYLLTNSGERVFIQEYQAPRNDGLGARFVFPRQVNGKPVITPESGEVLFHSEMGSGSGVNASISNSDIPSRDSSRVARDFGFTLNTRYKVKDMLFDGKLEF